MAKLFIFYIPKDEALYVFLRICVDHKIYNRNLAVFMKLRNKELVSNNILISNQTQIDENRLYINIKKGLKC